MKKPKKFMYRPTAPKSAAPKGSGDAHDKVMRKDEAEAEDKTKRQEIEDAHELILGTYRSMSKMQIELFHERKLGVVGIKDIEMAKLHLKKSATNLVACKYISVELTDFLSGKKLPEEKKEDEEIPMDDIPSEKEGTVPEEPESRNRETSSEDTAQLKFLINQLETKGLLVDQEIKEIKEYVAEVSGDVFKTNEVMRKTKDVLLAAIKKMNSGSGNTFKVEYPEANVPDKEMKGVMPEEFKDILQIAASRLNILLVGPSGCGKTFVVEKLAEILGLAYCAQSCSDGMDESIFAGMILPNKEGQFEYVPSSFVDIYENGGVYLLDELDAADSNLLIFINSAIGNNSFRLPRRRENTLVKRHKDFICVAAANTLGQGGDDFYIRNQLDGATLDRFRAGIIVMDYSKTVEKSIIHEKIYPWGIMVREAIAALKLPRIMSTRVMLHFSQLHVQHQWTLKKIANVYFADWPKEDRTRLESEVKNQLRRLKEETAGI